MSRVEYFSRCPRCASRNADTRGDNLGNYTDGSAFCFSCQFYKPSKIPVFKKESNVTKSLLPFDFTWEVPSRSWQWVIQFGLPISYWQPFTGYSPAEERLVFRVGNPLAFSIGRSQLEGVKKWYVWGDPHKHAEIVNPTGESANPDIVVLVEDLISAHKVAASGYTAIPLFGTQIHHPVLHYLSNNHSMVVLWLDQDQALPVKRKALRLESLIGKPVRVITTEKDPKCLSFTEIQNTITTIYTTF